MNITADFKSDLEIKIDKNQWIKSKHTLEHFIRKLLYQKDDFLLFQSIFFLLFIYKWHYQVQLLCRNNYMNELSIKKHKLIFHPFIYFKIKFGQTFQMKALQDFKRSYYKTQRYRFKKEQLRSKIREEQKIVNFNTKKLMAYRRRTMRAVKTEQLKLDIELYSQNNKRELDSKEAFIQMLDKNLDEAEDQYQIALRNHLIHLENFHLLQESRNRALLEEFERDIKILQEEFQLEFDDMTKTHKQQVKELEDTIKTVEEEEKRKAELAKNQHQTNREETKNKDVEDTSQMKQQLEDKQTKFYNDLEQMHQKYQSDTAKKTEDHTKYYDANKDMSKKIERLVRSIASKKAKIDLTKYKILQHTKECNARNQALKKEKENIAKNYQDLKLKMNKFREEQSRLLKELVNNSRNAVLKLTEYKELGEKILKTAELCRRLETEREKVLPFYEDTVDMEQIPENQTNDFEVIEKGQYEEFAYLNNFYKRYNKVLLDILAIQKQKEALQNESNQLQSLLKQYLDGLPCNDDVLSNPNPLFVKNFNIDLGEKQVTGECNCKGKEWDHFNDIIIINNNIYMNQKLDILKQVKIPRSISTTNQKDKMKKLNNQSMQTIVDKLPPINPQPLQRIQTELQDEQQCVKYVTAKFDQLSNIIEFQQGKRIERD
ncbi:unnamed protein product [Paramecium sonneborni]|uniref:Dynein regulatory complex subunit 2 n=1 Tax=Paramecium sonneborni TaxID=65129 RepID=A0A8S1R8E5_9CILI|nr:unnamed protein product [Paramecium sonneborni]